MSQKISASMLLEGIKRVKPGLASRSRIPILKQVAIMASKESLTLATTDLDAYTEVNLPINAGEFDAVIDLKALENTLKMFKDEMVTLNKTEHSLQLVCNDSVTEFASLDIDKFPSRMFTDENLQTDNELIDKLLEASEFAATNEARPVLTGILLDGENVVATNGHVLIIKKHTANYTQQNIPVNTVKKCKTVFKKCNQFETAYNNRYFTITSSYKNMFIAVTTRLVEGNYPQYRQLIPSNYRQTTTVNNAALLNALNAAPKEALVAKLEFAESKLQIAFTMDDLKTNLSIPAKHQGDMERISFNPKYLALTKVFDKEKDIELQFTGEYSPMVVNNDETMILILPVRTS